MTYEIIVENTSIEVLETTEIIEITDNIIPVQGEPGTPFTSEEFPFPIPLLEWVIPHNKNYYPSVTILDNSRIKCESTTEYPDKNTVIIRFGFEFSGSAIIN
jgi:hypothetical protein